MPPLLFSEPIVIKPTTSKVEQQDAVVELYNRISTVNKQAAETLRQLNGKKQEGDEHYARAFPTDSQRSHYKRQDESFTLLLDMIPKLSAYMLELEEFDEKFRAEWKGEKKGSVEKREMFLERKRREISKLEARFTGDVNESKKKVVEFVARHEDEKRKRAEAETAAAAAAAAAVDDEAATKLPGVEEGV